MLSKSLAEQKAENRQMRIFSTIRYLSRQGLALRGYYKAGDESGKRGEFDSNFLQLLRTRAEENPQLLKWMEKSQDKFTSPQIQNEILSIMAHHILREIANVDRLQIQLNALHTSAGSETSLTDVQSVLAYLKSLNSVEKQ